jgi:hypothetical protein
MRASASVGALFCYAMRAMPKEPLEKLSTEELERQLETNSFRRPEEKAKAWRILESRYGAPDQNLHRSILAMALGILLAALLMWLLL